MDEVTGEAIRSLLLLEDSSDSEEDVSIFVDSDFSDASNSSDDDRVFMRQRQVPKNEHYFLTVEQYDDSRFIEHFRVSRHVANKIAAEFEMSTHFKLDRGPNGKKLSAYQQTLIFLWFAGHQTASFRDVADRFDVTISSLHRVSRRLIYFLSGISKKVIKWPTENEKIRIAEGFGRRGFLPNVIGSIDGSHIRIDCPSQDPKSYYNRKKYFSIQLQVACDDRMKITSLLVGFPGSVHDARVFRRSPLGQNLPQRCGQYVLLGDSAYPCSRNLLTPFKDNGTLSRRQKKFNKMLSRARVTVEHCFGLLKQKFRQLFHCKLRVLEDLVHFIRACCVLHNLAIEDDFPYDFNSDSPETAPTNFDARDGEEEEELDASDGITYRNTLLASHLFD